MNFRLRRWHYRLSQQLSIIELTECCSWSDKTSLLLHVKFFATKPKHEHSTTDVGSESCCSQSISLKFGTIYCEAFHLKIMITKIPWTWTAHEQWKMLFKWQSVSTCLPTCYGSNLASSLFLIFSLHLVELGEIDLPIIIIIPAEASLFAGRLKMDELVHIINTWSCHMQFFSITYHWLHSDVHVMYHEPFEFH